MKKLITKLIRYIKFGYKCDSKTYIKYLRKKGITIGNDVNLYSPQTIRIDITKPYLISIGNNVHITAGVTILNHDYAWIVANRKNGNVFGNVGKVTIGNNIFIGNNTTILKDTEIGDNIIIGANSLVNKKILKPGVYAGIPAKYIMSIEEYTENRLKKQYEEAKDIVIEYYKKYNKIPTKEAMGAYFWLFEERNTQHPKLFEKINNRTKKTNDLFNSTKPLFNGYEEFIKSINLETK